MARATTKKQTTVAMAADQGAGFERYRKPMRREAFLAQMETLVAWSGLGALIEPHYPKAGNGRLPIGLQRMLRIHLLRHRFNLAEEAMEGALYDSAWLRAFVGIDLGGEPVPDATSLLRFGRLLEKHRLGEASFAQVGQLLQAQGLKPSGGTSVNARTGVVHAAVVTAANAHDTHPVPDLLHGKATRVYADRGYQGCTDVIRKAAPNAKIGFRGGARSAFP